MGKLKQFLSVIKMLWNPPREAVLVRSLVFACLGIFAILMGTTFWLVHSTREAHHPVNPLEEEELAANHEGGEHGEAKGEGHGEGAEAHGEGHEGAQVNIFQNPIPKEIRRRRDGVMESGHDLVDPDIKSLRGLASILSDEVKVTKAYRFIEFPEIMAGTRANEAISGKVLTTISVEADSLESEQEVRARLVEFQGLIASMISERKRDALRTMDGRSALKMDIQREINHKLKKGHVTDVLLLTFFVM